MLKQMLGWLLIGLVFSPLSALAQYKGRVGVSMPTVALQRWVVDGLALGRALGKLDYEADLRFAENSTSLQIQQIDRMIEEGAKVLIIAPIDGPTLKGVLKKAADRKIKVLSYDRLIRDSAHVDAYATFDNFQVGVMQGEALVKRLEILERVGNSTIELFAGSPDDNNATFFYNGAMSVLKPLIESGKLVVGSGQTDISIISTPQWNGATARLRLDKLLISNYKSKNIDGILAPNDGIAIELIASLKHAGYGQPGKPFPIVTGQDADLPSVRSIAKSEQAFTIFKDTRTLAEVAATIADALLQDKSVPTNDTSSYHNGVKLINSYLLKPQLIDKNNWYQLLVGSGYYKSHQFNKQ